MDEQKQAKVDELLAKIEASEKANAKLPEAGGIAFTTLYTRRGAPVNVTERGASSQKALAALVHTIEWAYLALDMSTSKPEPPAAQPPKEPADQRIAREVGNAPLAAELKAQTEAVPPPPDGKVYETVDVQEIHIEPKADGMVSVEFWNPGRKYSEEYVKWKPENVLGLLKYAMTVQTNEDGTIKAQKATCPVRVYYTLGKEKTGPNAKPGSRWHDVAHVRPI